MIFLDSWIWIEFFSQDKKAEKAETIIQKLEEEKGYISTIVTMEVRYRIRRKFGEEKADQVTLAIESFDNLEIMPITNEVGKYAADLRDKYYKRREREISYGDEINLAVTVLTDCEKLYTGDPDFKNIKEIPTEII